MTHVTHPTPAQVRAWMSASARKNSPPPTPEQIRRELGWGLVGTAGQTMEGRS
jgi:hypothetical protein